MKSEIFYPLTESYVYCAKANNIFQLSTVLDVSRSLNVLQSVLVRFFYELLHIPGFFLLIVIVKRKKTKN